MTPPPGLAERSRIAAEQASQPCDYCAQPIVWAATAESRMPVNAFPDTDGNVLLTVDNAGLHAKVLGRPADRVSYRAGGWALYLHHRLTCPSAAEWTRKLTAGRPARPSRRRPADPGQASFTDRR